MTAKEYFQPNKYKVAIFIILFILIFFIPYLKAEPTPGIDKIVEQGRYPLIFIFLMSLVVIMDLLSGNFILGDFVLFISFLAAFTLLYALVSGVVYLFIERKKDKAPAPDKPRERKDKPVPKSHADSSYVLHLENNDKPKDEPNESVEEQSWL